MKVTSSPLARAASTSATEAVVVVEYCGYSGSTRISRAPAAMPARKAGASAGSP